ncbi:Amino acid transporter AVT1B [Hondaea fermentalgiana]|uniref:Amino acid transporter AVT1B n=1 Tax=Hondaea fermentalgiana TaxID=2315210 RepID=A0A2R5GCE2_9STRA|nr:Amino acid transporter AVT1B [Hondaea fermentalgiana]|eukprot:GBG28019.1 Amino acid transporter AVT1B [Hondaea fermentalgiana]
MLGDDKSGRSPGPNAGAGLDHALGEDDGLRGVERTKLTRLSLEVDDRSGEFVDEDAVPGVGGSAWGVSPWYTFVIVTAAFTTDNIAGPYAFQQSGWIAGTLFFIFGVATSYYTGRLLGNQSIPEQDEASYPKITERAFGVCGHYFALTMQVLSYFTLVVVLLVKLGLWMSLAARHVNEENRLCISTLIVVSAAILAVLVQTPTFSHVMPLAALSIAISLLRLILIYVQMSSYEMGTNCSPTYEIPEEEAGSQVLTFFRGLSTFMWMLGGHGMFPEEIREMREPQRHFYKALNWSFVIIVAQYVLTIVPTYFVWGAWTSPLLVDNLPDDNTTSAIVILSVVWMFIEAAISNLLLCLTVEVHVYNLSPLKQCLREPGTLVPPVVKRVVHRLGVVLAQLFFGLMLQDAGVGNIQAFVGAFGFGALTFWLPYILEMFRVPNYRGLHTVLLIIGVVVSVFGMYTSMASITAATSGGLFSSECRHLDLLDPLDGPCIYDSLIVSNDTFYGNDTVVLTETQP